MITKLPLHKVETLTLIGQWDLYGSDTGILDNSLIQFRLIFRDEADGDIGVEKFGIARPPFQHDQRVAVFGRHVGDIAGRSDGLSEVEHEGDLFSVGDTETEVVIQDVEDCVWTTRN